MGDAARVLIGAMLCDVCIHIYKIVRLCVLYVCVCVSVRGQVFVPGYLRERLTVLAVSDLVEIIRLMFPRPALAPVSEGRRAWTHDACQSGWQHGTR